MLSDCVFNETVKRPQSSSEIKGIKSVENVFGAWPPGLSMNTRSSLQMTNSRFCHFDFPFSHLSSHFDFLLTFPRNFKFQAGLKLVMNSQQNFSLGLKFFK